MADREVDVEIEYEYEPRRPDTDGCLGCLGLTLGFGVWVIMILGLAIAMKRLWEILVS